MNDTGKHGSTWREWELKSKLERSKDDVKGEGGWSAQMLSQQQSAVSECCSHYHTARDGAIGGPATQPAV